MRIAIRVKILANLIEKEFRASSAVEDMIKMTNMHGRIIAFLHRYEDRDIYQRDIEQNFMISGPSVSEVLKLMQKNGLIEKKSVERDGRLKKIVLTEKGRRMDADVQQSIDSVENQLAEMLTPEELAAFEGTVDKLIRKLKERKSKEVV